MLSIIASKHVVRPQRRNITTRQRFGTSTSLLWSDPTGKDAGDVVFVCQSEDGLEIILRGGQSEVIPEPERATGRWITASVLNELLVRRTSLPQQKVLLAVVFAEGWHWTNQRSVGRAGTELLNRKS